MILLCLSSKKNYVFKFLENISDQFGTFLFVLNSNLKVFNSTLAAGNYRYFLLLLLTKQL
jgi:hypothetical protein